MVDMGGEEEWGFDVQRVGQGVRDQGWVRDGDAAVDTQDFNMRDRAQISQDLLPGGAARGSAGRRR